MTPLTGSIKTVEELREIYLKAKFGEPITIYWVSDEGHFMACLVIHSESEWQDRCITNVKLLKSSRGLREWEQSHPKRWCNISFSRVFDTLSGDVHLFTNFWHAYAACLTLSKG